MGLSPVIVLLGPPVPAQPASTDALAVAVWLLVGALLALFAFRWQRDVRERKRNTELLRWIRRGGE